MALTLKIGPAGAEVNRISLLVWESLRVEQHADTFVSTVFFQLIDETGALDVVEKDSVLLEDGATKYFAGTVANVTSVNMADGTESLLLDIQCQDYNLRVEEVVIDQLEEYGGMTDAAIIDDLFDKYLPEINSHGPGGAPPGYVQTLHVFSEISFENCTLREALDRIATEVEATALKGYWYIDYDKYLHYFNEEDNAPAWSLSDTPDGVNSFPYYAAVRRTRESSTLMNRILVVGADVALLVQDYDSYAYYGKWYEGIVRDNTLEGVEDVISYGYGQLSKYAYPDEYFELSILKEGLRAGMNLEFINTLFGTGLRVNRIKNPSFEINLNSWTFGQGGAGGSAARDNAHVLRGTQACKLVASDAGGSWMMADVFSLAVGETATIQASMYRTGSVAGRVMLWDATNAVSRGFVDAAFTTVWETLTVSWTNDTVGAVNISLVVFNLEDDAAGSFWFDACVAEIDKGPRPVVYVDGTMPYCGWYGAAHDSWSYRNPVYMVKTLTITWPFSDDSGVPEPQFDLQLGGDISCSALIKARLSQDKYGTGIGPVVPGQLPLCSKGWSHDLVFSATDNNTVAWAAGTITTADGTTFSIVPGNTGDMAAATVYYIYLDIDTSLTALQVTGTGPAVGKNIILVAVAYPNADAAKEAEYQVFGGRGVKVFITADNIAANTITGNEIAANTITAGNIQAGTITATEIAANTITGGNIAANTVTADKILMGDLTFTESEGLFLLSPSYPFDATHWYGSRGNYATISGAFHQGQGRWLGTRGLIVEPGTTNYCRNPAMYDGDSDDLADQWTKWKNTVNDTVKSVIDHPISERGWLQKFTYTAVVGDVGATIGIFHRTGAATFAAGEDAVFSVDIQVEEKVGCTAQVLLRAEDAGNNALGSEYLAVNLKPGLIQRVRLNYETLPANTDHMRVEVRGTGLDNGDSFDIRFGAANVEKQLYPTSYCCGDLPWCTWQASPYNSRSDRSLTQLVLDDHVGMVSDNTKISFASWFQIPYDSSETEIVSGVGIVMCAYKDANNRIYYGLKYKLGLGIAPYMQVQGNQTEGALISFDKGSWHLMVVTCDFDNDEYYLYFDGEEVGEDLIAKVAPTGLTEWNVGSWIDGTYNAGYTHAQFAAFDRVLTHAEVSNLYNIDRPLIDASFGGLQNRPGIYIQDGMFSVASAITGARVIMDADGIRGYNAAELTFQLNTDGSGQIGASSYEPITWDTTGLIQRLKAVQLNIGEPLFTEADGLILLNSYGSKTAAEWHGSRGERVLITGAFQVKQGDWAGTGGLQVHPGSTNLITNPSWEVDQTGWVPLGGGFSTNTRSTIQPVSGRYCNRLVNSSGVDSWLYHPFTATATTSTVTLYVRVTAGSAVTLALQQNFGAYVVIGSVASTKKYRWERLVVTGATAIASSYRLRLTVPNGTALYVDAAQAEGYGFPTTYLDGSLGSGFSWTGAAHGSTSIRAATDVNLDNYSGLVASLNTVSYCLRCRPEYDADVTWPTTSNYLMDLCGADNNERIIIRYKEDTDKFWVYYNGADRLESPVQSFKKGELIQVIVTCDYSSDIYKLYVNGILEDTSTDAAAAPPATDWVLGCSKFTVYQSSWVIDEFAVFNRVLTADEAARLWESNRMLVDMGSLRKPGIYMLDGQFKLASSTSGMRTEIRPEGIGIYAGAGETNIARLLGGRVNTTSKILDPEASTLGWFGYDASNVLQVAWYGSGTNAGKIVAGAGEVVLDANGLTLVEGDASPNRIEWKKGGTVLAMIYGVDNDPISGNMWVYADAEDANHYAQVVIGALGDGANHNVEIIITSGRTGDDNPKAYIYTDYLEVDASDNSLSVKFSNCPTFTIHDGSISNFQISGGNVTIKLGDAAGAKMFTIKDSAAVALAWCDSDGNFDIIGNFSTDGGSTPWSINGPLQVGAVVADRYLTMWINGLGPYLLGVEKDF